MIARQSKLERLLLLSESNECDKMTFVQYAPSWSLFSFHFTLVKRRLPRWSWSCQIKNKGRKIPIKLASLTQLKIGRGTRTRRGISKYSFYFLCFSAGVRSGVIQELRQRVDEVSIFIIPFCANLFRHPPVSNQAFLLFPLKVVISGWRNDAAFFFFVFDAVVT